VASAARQVSPLARRNRPGVADLDGQDAGQKLRRFRQQERQAMKRRVPLPHGLQRALHRRHQIARGIGHVGEPRRVGVRRHHDPREIAVIGARLERARAPRRDRDDGRRPQRAQRRNPVRARGFGGQHHEAPVARGDDHRHPHAQVARARATRSAGVGRRGVRGRVPWPQSLAGCCRELKHSLAPSHGCVRYSYSSLCDVRIRASRMQHDARRTETWQP
jgi:hypothetical protein